MNIKAVLFDMDGVLVDSFEAWYHLFCSTLRHFGRPPITRNEFIQRAWSLGFEVVSRRYFVGRGVEEVAQYYFSHFLDHKQHLKPMDGVAGVLEKIQRQGIHLAVISNTHTPLVDKILRQVGLLDYFVLTIGGDKVKKCKPAPDMVLLACRQLGIKPGAAVVVGDTEYDLAAARQAGCLAVGYKTEGDVKINNLGELLRVVG
jgi:phosphoglycolate phosphatase